MKSNRVFFFNITYKCNNSCLECVSKQTREHSNRIINLKEFENFNTKFKFTYTDRFVISGGEPTIHPDFEKIINYISSYSTHIIVFTNGRILSTIDNKVLNKIERFVIPFYGDEFNHNKYTGNFKSYIETLESIKNISEYSEKIELKLIIQDICALNFFSIDENFKSLIKQSSKTISIAGFIDYATKRSVLQDVIYESLERFINKLLDIGKIIKIYDIPLCKFSSCFIEHIDNTFNNNLSILFNLKICCSSTGEYKEVGYNSIPNYFPNCIECRLNTICTMVLKRYNVLCISKCYSCLDTE